MCAEGGASSCTCVEGGLAHEETCCRGGSVIAKEYRAS